MGAREGEGEGETKPREKRKEQREQLHCLRVNELCKQFLITCLFGSHSVSFSPVEVVPVEGKG